MKKKLGLALILAIVSSGVLAGWEPVGSTGSFDLYVDRNTIRKSGTTVKMWHLIDYKTLQKESGSESYWSTKTQSEYNCNEESSRSIYYLDNTEKMGGGNVAYTGDRVLNWKPVPPESVGKKLLNVACGVQ